MSSSPLRIAVVTPTVRANPRADIIARTIAASSMRAKGVLVTWIVVDEKQRGAAQLGILREDAIDPTHAVVSEAIAAHSFEFVITPPARSPHREPGDRRPAHNTFRNTGLRVALEAGADYVVMLNDCNIVTPDWVSVAADCAKKSLGWKCKSKELVDAVVPPNGLFRYHDHHDLLRPIPILSAAGGCWGAPAAKFAEIQGFDLAYDGEYKGNDIECALRLGRVGVSFVTTERAFTVQLRRTKIDAEVTTNKDAHFAKANRARLRALQADASRTLPEVVAEPFRAHTVVLGPNAINGAQEGGRDPDHGAGPGGPAAPSSPPEAPSAPPKAAGDARGRDDAQAVKSPCCRAPLRESELRGVTGTMCVRCRKFYPPPATEAAEPIVAITDDTSTKGVAPPPTESKATADDPAGSSYTGDSEGATGPVAPASPPVEPTLEMAIGPQILTRDGSDEAKVIHPDGKVELRTLTEGENSLADEFDSL
ncbi:MAG TPA: hypothetical protein VFD36_29490 [Kofleriaceae bacterium]|nr:hypothetical protein [Kofleriaceae bacterium]